MSKEPDFVPEDTRTDQALAIAGIATAAIPWLGGPLSAVLSGVSFGRKIDRVKEVVNGIVTDLREFRSEASERYVQTDEFQELLEAALLCASEERNEEKRKVYRDFVVNAIRRPGEPYDEQLRVLRTLEELDPDHIWLLADSSKKARLEDLSKQLDLLREFLGKPASDFMTLQNVGNTWDEQWRREKAQGIREWVERHRSQFPQHVQEALTGIMNLAGTTVAELGMQLAQRPESFQMSSEWLDTVKKYVNELKAELYRTA